MTELSKNLRSALLNELRDTPKTVALSLSGGPDSLSVLFALDELDRDIHAYTYAPEGIESSDLRVARSVCDSYNINHTTVRLPTHISQIKQDTHALVAGLNLTSKTDIECMWPRWYLLREVDEKTLVTGDCSDAHFANSKKGALHYSDSVELMNQYRDEHFSDPNYAQLRTIRRVGEQYGVDEVIAPYRSEKIQDLFYDTSWSEVNEPKKKTPILQAFADSFNSVPTNTANLQCGDSGIQDQFEKLLDTDWNTQDWKSPVGIYNALVRGEIP